MTPRVRQIGLAVACAVLLLGPSQTAQSRPVAAPAQRQATGPRLSVDVAAHRHRISAGIYGVNFAGRAFARRTRLPVDRWGGNAAETYNWKIRGSNHGNDWYFENFPDCWTPAFGYCTTGHHYSAADAQIRRDRATGASTLLTLPLDGRVARAVAYDNSNPCSFPAGRYDPQDGHDPYHAACGNGRRGGVFVADPDTSIAGTRADAGFDAAWVAHLVSEYGDARGGGVGIYELGNEPGLWDQTHHDFHPDPVGYSARPSGAGPTTSARASTCARSGPATPTPPTAPLTAAPRSRRGTCGSSRPPSSRPAPACSTTSTCTTTRRAATSPPPT
jgi:hypothetical protein